MPHTARRPPESTEKAERSQLTGAHSPPAWRAPSAPGASSPHGRRSALGAPRPALPRVAHSPAPSAATPSSGCGQIASQDPRDPDQGSTAAREATSPAQAPTQTRRCVATGSRAKPRPRPSATPSPSSCPAPAAEPHVSACDRRPRRIDPLTLRVPPRSAPAGRALPTTTALGAPFSDGALEALRTEARAGGAPDPCLLLNRLQAWHRADLVLRHLPSKSRPFSTVLNNLRAYLELHEPNHYSRNNCNEISHFKSYLGLHGFPRKSIQLAPNSNR
jgi:hypothetical protein